MTPAKPRRTPRHRGHYSPLDRLSPAASRQLIRRLDRWETLRVIVAWLQARHGCKTTDTSLSKWNQRREERRGANAGAGREAKLRAGEFEIALSALPSGKVRMSVHSITPATNVTAGGQIKEPRRTR